MNPIASTLMLSGAVLALIASLGLLRFSTPYARFHSAGKASPISFFLIATGVGFELGVAAGVQLAIASIALAITMPSSTHLLFRAVHRTTDSNSAAAGADGHAHDGPHGQATGTGEADTT